MEPKNQRVESLLQALTSSSVQDSFEILDQILDFQGQVPTENLQDLYVQGLFGLFGKEPSDSEFLQINDRLRKTPAYADNEARVLEHAQHLTDSVRRSRSYSKALKLANQIHQIKGYGTSAPLQEQHATALFETTQIPGSSSFDSAELIKKIPSFSDSPKIQFACAKTYCNITSQSTSAKEIQQAVSEIKGLSQLNNSDEIRESLQRAERNLERFKEVQLESRPKRKKPIVLAAGAFLTAGLLSFSYFSGPQKVQTPAPSPTTASLLEKQASELESYIAQAYAAFDKKDYDEATTYGLMSLRLAQQLRHKRIRNESLDILASSYTRLNEPEQAQTYYKKIHKESLPDLAENHLKKAESLAKSDGGDELLYELKTSATMASQAEQKLDPNFLERGAKLGLDNKLWGPSARFLELQGKLAEAADIAEKAGELDLTKSILEKLVEADPGQKSKLTAFTLKSSAAILEEAQAAFQQKNFKLAEKKADTVLSQIKGVPEAGEQGAQAYTLLAKIAYSREIYPKAAEFAKQAHTSSPNQDRKTRLDNYRAKDAEIVTRDELDVDTFVFPPAVKDGKKYTYAYYLSSQTTSRGQGAEKLFQGPNDDIEVRGQTRGYSQNPVKPQGAYVSIRTYEGQSFSFRFDAGKDKSLTPGIYEGATGSNFKNPGFSFNLARSSGSSSRARFVVHQAEWKREVIKRKRYQGRGKYKTYNDYGDYELHRFAADFIAQGAYRRSKATTYGKIRYNSDYK